MKILSPGHPRKGVRLELRRAPLAGDRPEARRGRGPRVGPREMPHSSADHIPGTRRQSAIRAGGVRACQWHPGFVVTLGGRPVPGQPSFAAPSAASRD